MHWKIIYENIPLPFTLFAVIGFWAARKRLWLLTLFLASSGAALIREQLPPPDHQGYLLPAILVVIIWTAYGFDLVLNMVRRLKISKIRNGLKLFVIAVSVLSMIFLYQSRFPRHNLRNNYWAHNFGRTILSPLPQNSIVLFNDIISYFICRYLQVVENFRSDCDIILPGMLNHTSSSRKWYAEELLSRTRINGLDSLRNTSIQIIVGVIENNHRNRPIFCEYGDNFRPFANYLQPFGLLFQFSLDSSFIAPPDYSFPDKQEIGSDFGTASAYSARLYALSLYYQDRGVFSESMENYNKSLEMLEGFE